jgi:hypothetical protein
VSIVEPSPRLEVLCDALEVNPAQRLEFRADPALAIELLEYARRRPRIKNAAAFAVSRFRRRRVQVVAAELDGAREDLPDVEDLERGLAFARAAKAPAPIIASIEVCLDRARALQSSA